MKRKQKMQLRRNPISGRSDDATTEEPKNIVQLTDATEVKPNGGEASAGISDDETEEETSQYDNYADEDELSNHQLR